MHRELWGVLVAGVGIVLGAGLAPGGVEAAAVTVPYRASIVVRTYTQPAVAADMRTARRIAGAILDQADIRVAWLECALPGEDDERRSRCAQPLQSNELVVRIVSAAPMDARPGPDTLGFAFIDPQAGGGWLATVFLDRVTGMAGRAGIDAGELMGRTIAHELGHLLIGSDAHAAHGLMRSSWSTADLRRNRATQWLFGGKEGEAMRRRIAGGAE